jgi:CheY-like chemotaxis protein
VAEVKLEQGEDIKKYLKDSVEITLKAGDLTNQLLTFAKGGAPIKKAVSLGKLIERTSIYALRGSNILAQFYIPPDLWPVFVNAGQITQVINNLIINAKQAMADGGAVEVAASNIFIEPGIDKNPGKYIRVSIKDCGLGISKEHLAKIFDPFFTTKIDGTGLGLATCYSIITRHGGYIEVESKEGLGTTFFIYLPASDLNVIPIETEKETVVTGIGYRILLLDDEILILQAVSQMLKSFGHKVVLAKDGLEAIEIYKQAKESGEPFDAVVLDLTIPGGMGGSETLAHLQEMNPNIKTIISSGYANDPIIANYDKYGFFGVVTKPYKVGELQEVLTRVIDSKQLLLELIF